jgi:hypothetical protein
MLKIVENEAVREEGYTLDALAREGARRMLMSALEEEARRTWSGTSRHVTRKAGASWCATGKPGRGALPVVRARWKCGPLG